MRNLRNTYAALLLLVVLAAHGFLWLPPGLIEPHPVGLPTVIVALLGMVVALTRARVLLAHVSTFVHELSHCVAAIAIGASPRRITYQPDSTGLAILEFPEKVGRLRRSVVLLAGYLGPGIGAGTILSGVLAGKARETLVVLAAIATGALLLLVRNLWGAGVTALIAIVAAVSARSLPVIGAELLLAFLMGALATLGVRDAWDQYHLREPGSCDAAVVSREFPLLPWRGVAAFQLLVAGALALVVGALLVRSV